MKDFYKEMQMVDLIEKQPIYKSKLLMEWVPGARLRDGSDLYFIPVTAERMKDPLFSFLKDGVYMMMGTIESFQDDDPQRHTLFVNSHGHLVGNDRLKKSIGQTVYTKPLAYFYETCPERLRTDGTSVYVDVCMENEGVIVKILYVLLWFNDHADEIHHVCEVPSGNYEAVLKSAEPKDLLNALVVHFNDTYDNNERKIERLMWENISIGTNRDILRQIQVQGMYYPECTLICRKEENYEN